MRRNRKISRNIGKQSEGGTLIGKLAAMMARDSTKRYWNVYTYVCKKRLKKFLSLRKICANFHPPPPPLSPRRRGRSTREQLAKTEDWLGRSTNEVASSESPDDDINKSRGRIHRYTVRDEHRTRIIAQRSEDNGTRPMRINTARCTSRSMDQYLRTDISHMHVQPAIDQRSYSYSWIDDCHVRFEQSDSRLFSDFLACQFPKKRLLNVSLRDVTYVPLKMEIK